VQYERTHGETVTPLKGETVPPPRGLPQVHVARPG
jgi:hypothetical protein